MANSSIIIGIVMPSSVNWDGGFNYFNNIIEILLSSNKKIKVVIFCYNDTFKKMVSQKRSNVTLVNLGHYSKIYSFFRLLLASVLRSDIIFKTYLDKFCISLLIYGSEPMGRVSCKQFAWIADFQHLELPQNFSLIRRIARTMLFKNHFRSADKIILSSYHAQEQLKKYFNGFYKSTDVLISRFRVNPFRMSNDLKDDKNISAFKENFFLCPMQLHKHKNQIHIIKAFASIPKVIRDKYKLILCGSGYTSDNPIFRELKQFISANNLNTQVLLLGRVANATLAQLFKECFAIITASSYEGWSTVLEEARAIQVKRLIVSDLPIHKEQLKDESVVWFQEGSTLDLNRAILEIIGQKYESKCLDPFCKYKHQYANYKRQIISFCLK
jgi:glycosyltransferase involved in cell wall biosynthesis